MRNWCVAWCVAAVAFSGSLGFAAELSGPYLDWKDIVPQPPSNLPTVIHVPTQYLSFNPLSIKKDTITIIIDLPGLFGDLLGKAVAYESYDDLTHTGNVTITTLYGLDLDPNGTSLAMTGFAPSSAAVFHFADEKFIGNSGTEYQGVSLGAVTLAELPVLMAGYDLSPFQGDPSSIVYAFRTIAPSSDFVPVPESSTLALAAMGMLSLAVYGWRSRRRAIA